MESLELRIFREVAHAQSISRAADKMNYAQSGVTAHIRKLEEELGTALFIRHSRGVTLTAEGKELLGYADRILGLLDNAKSLLRKNAAVLRIGAIQTIAAGRLPGWLARLKEICPEARLSVTVSTQSELAAAVADGQLDGAFVHAGLEHPRLQTILVFPEPLALIAAPGTPPDKLAGQPIVVADFPGCPYRQRLEAWTLRHTSRQPETLAMDSVEAILKAVSLGLGISLLPYSVLPPAYPAEIFPADELERPFIQFVTLREGEHPLLGRFTEAVCATV
ncbi:LysR family transcriptional regulator [Gorillibacterium sp. sgz500922]|uniref:LysR family transcriptional regulator n=1 Tax=Gorillibacterium sp. sgz500922 TaxID=3446694 RepID=UPI003F663369